MVKKKKLKTKIAVFSFIVLFLSSSFLPSQLNAAPLITWDNPNSKGYENPFKISWDTVITADLLTQVVGCTGLTNKLARTILWTREKTRQFFKELLTEKTAGTVCRIVKGGSQTALGATPGVVSSNLPKGIDWAIDCGDVSNPTYDPKVLNMLKEQEEKEDQREFTRQCFNGIAFTLAAWNASAAAESSTKAI